MLSNGMGGLDWSGLPFVCEALGVRNVEGLMQRLAVIKLRRRGKGNEGN